MSRLVSRGDGYDPRPVPAGDWSIHDRGQVFLPFGGTAPAPIRAPRVTKQGYLILRRFVWSTWLPLNIPDWLAFFSQPPVSATGSDTPQALLDALVANNGLLDIVPGNPEGMYAPSNASTPQAVLSASYDTGQRGPQGQIIYSHRFLTCRPRRLLDDVIKVDI